MLFHNTAEQTVDELIFEFFGRCFETVELGNNKHSCEIIIKFIKN